MKSSLRIFLFALSLSFVTNPSYGRSVGKVAKSHPSHVSTGNHHAGHVTQRKSFRVSQKARTSGGCNNCTRVLASWYALHGRQMANGKPMNKHALTAAHRTLPLGTSLYVLHEGRSVVVTVTDRGPYHGNRGLDLSQAAADAVGLRQKGTGYLYIRVL